MICHSLCREKNKTKKAVFLDASNLPWVSKPKFHHNSSPSPSRSTYSRISLKVSNPLSFLSSSMTTKRWTRDLRMVSKMESRRSLSVQVKMPGKSYSHVSPSHTEFRLEDITSERLSKASPTVRFRSSYTPPLMSDMTSTASKTLTTPPRSVLVDVGCGYGESAAYHRYQE